MLFLHLADKPLKVAQNLTAHLEFKQPKMARHSIIFWTFLATWINVSLTNISWQCYPCVQVQSKLSGSMVERASKGCQSRSVSLYRSESADNSSLHWEVDSHSVISTYACMWGLSDVKLIICSSLWGLISWVLLQLTTCRSKMWNYVDCARHSEKKKTLEKWHEEQKSNMDAASEERLSRKMSWFIPLMYCTVDKLMPVHR